MIKKESKHTAFAQDTKMTPGILSIIANIADRSLTSAKQRAQASQKYLDALKRAINKGDQKDQK